MCQWIAVFDMDFAVFVCEELFVYIFIFFFFYNDSATTENYTLSLHDALPILKQNAKREMRLRLGKVTVADVLAAQPVTTNLLKFMRASIKMIGVSNLQSFIASMTQKLTLSDISDESKNYLDKAGITTACLRIKSKWTAGGK